jgi:ATP-dependent Clp protease ATP-binding subunit ClpB
MQREIEDRLAKLLLAGEVADGSLVKVSVSPDASSLAVGAE